MFNNISRRLTVVALSVLSFSAVADTKYPAHDFKPQVIYKDIGLIAATGSKLDARYPASHFEPRVLFQDKDLIEKTGSKAAANSSCRP